MKNHVFSKRSLGNLSGVHPHLQAVAVQTLKQCELDFVVICGLRTIEEQRALVRTGKSWTMDSLHLTGYAIDVVPLVNGKIDWDDLGPFVTLGEAFRTCGDAMGVPITWGGDWDGDGDWREHRQFDGPHMQLDKAHYDHHAPHPVQSLEEWGIEFVDALTSSDGQFCAIKSPPERPQPRGFTKSKSRKGFAPRSA